MKRLFAALVLSLALAPGARGADDYTGYLENLAVAPGQSLQNVVCFACSTRIEGTVGGNLVLAWGGGEIRGSVEGTIVVVGGGIHLAPGAKVGGEVVIVGGRLDRDPAATVAGTVTEQWWLYFPGQRQFFLQGALVYTGIVVGLALFGYGLFGGRRTGRMTDALRRRPFAAFLLGLILSVLAFYGLVSVEAFGDYEDQALYMILMVGFLLALPGFAAMSLWLGFKITKKAGVVATLSGALAWTALMVLPLAGLVVAVVLYAFCVGGPALARYGFGPGASRPPVQMPGPS